MLVLLPTLVALIATAVFAVVAIRFRRSARTLVASAVVDPGGEDEARRLVGAVRRRMLVAVLAGALVAVVVALLPIDHLQTAAALAPGIGAAAGLVIIIVSPFPRRVPVAGLRRAELTPRGMATFGPRWGFVLPIVAAVILVVLLIATGLSGSVDDEGRPRGFIVVTPAGTSQASPYPGWFYDIPILVATVVLIVFLLAALNRIAMAPRTGSELVGGLDPLLRSTLTRFVMLLGSAVTVLYIGTVALVAGGTARSASQWVELKPSIEKAEAAEAKAKGSASFIGHSSDFLHGVVQPTYTLGAVGAVVGIVLLGVAIVLAVLALTNGVIRWSVKTPAEPEKVAA